MSIDIEMTGSGTLGPITPGWSVQESATPVIIGDSASTSGSVSFTAATRDDSLLAINNYITTTHPDLGHVDGIVKSVSQQGISTNITHSNVLANYDAEYDIPGLYRGSTCSALDLATQLTKQEIRLKSGLTGVFWSRQGHNAGFDSEGNLVEGSKYINPDGLKWTDTTGAARNDRLIVSDKTATSTSVGKISNSPITNNLIFYNSTIYVNNFSTDIENRRNVLAFKMINTGSSTNLVLAWTTQSGNPSTNYTGTLGKSRFEFDKTNQQLYVYIDYIGAGLYTKLEEYVSLSGLDWSKEMAVFLEFNSSDGIFYSGVGYKYDYKISICNTDNYSNVVTYTKTIGVDNFALWHDYVALGYSISTTNLEQGFRSVWMRKDDTPFVVAEYENEQVFRNSSQYAVSPKKYTRVHPVKQNLWQWLQDACSTYGTEIYVKNGVLTIGDIGENILDISNISTPLSIAPNTTLTGKNVNIIYHSNSYSTITTSDLGATVYNSYLDGNREFKVNVGEILTTTVETDYVLEYVISPNISPYGSILTTLPVYNVSDANGLLAQSGWYDAGGRVFVSLNKDNKSAIDITVVAPAAAYGGYTPPYSLSLSSGGKEYSALRICGQGYRKNKKTLTLQTGATPEKTPQDVAKTIENVFLDSAADSYDRGIHASLDASGPRVTVSGTIPTSSINGFGLTPGSMFQYKDSIYRVTDCTIGDVAVSFNAVRYVTVADFDTVWSGKTVAQHDGVWGTNDVSDQIIMPLYQPL